MKEIVFALVVIVALGFVIVLMGISLHDSPAEKSAQASAFVVDTLFTHEGITVYRFYDIGKPIYFTSSGDMHWSKIGTASSATIVPEKETKE